MEGEHFVYTLMLNLCLCEIELTYLEAGTMVQVTIAESLAMLGYTIIMVLPV